MLPKHDLMMHGVCERGDMFYATRGIIFTGATRLAYKQELKRFLRRGQGGDEQDPGRHRQVRRAVVEVRTQPLQSSSILYRNFRSG
jgi:hypothetical protein